MLADVLARQIDASGTLLALANSGGGSRAAYFAQTILQRLGDVPWPGRLEESLLDHFDIISSVSGGSPAAYFAFKISGARRGGVRVAPPKVTLSTKPFANVASR